MYASIHVLSARPSSHAEVAVAMLMLRSLCWTVEVVHFDSSCPGCADGSGDHVPTSQGAF